MVMFAAPGAPALTGTSFWNDRDHDKKAARRVPGGLLLRGGADASWR